jgi:uncharacterized protein (TIGR03437 family)
MNRYALLLQEPPAAASRSVVRLRMGPEVAAAARDLGVKQAPVRAELARRKIHVTGSSRLLVNAIYVEADPSRLPELSRIPGVRRVAFLPVLKPALDHAEQLVNTAGAWNILGGISNAGLGVKVAVIDSGIDQTHPAFQDPSLTAPPGYPICAGSDCDFATNKVIVARSYIRQQAVTNPDDPASSSRPDDYSPRDHQGHGTAVSMIIAGVTNTGPGDTITGFAPKAYLGSYRVFGSPGVNDGASEDAVISALEDAVADGMDIANLSLGGAPIAGVFDSGDICGEPTGVPCDTLSQAVENATSLGLLVVVAAGNDGGAGTQFPTLASVETPAIAPSAIAVGASTNSHFWQFLAGGFASVESTNFNSIALFSSRGPAIQTAAIKPEIVAVGQDLFLTAQNYDPGGDLYNASRYTVSNGTSFSSPMVAGSAALLKQLHPDWLPGQLKSALVNTATQDLTDRGLTAAITATGAGKLNSGNALSATVTITPPTASFGVIQSLPATQTFQVKNNGSATVNLQLKVEPRNSDMQATLNLDRSSLSIAPGATATFSASLTGNQPVAGSYEGFITLQGDAVPLHIPYLYLVGDGVPVNVISLVGDLSNIGLAGQDVPDGELAFQVIDQFGLPVPNFPVTFAVRSGGGKIPKADDVTNAYGIATAEAVLGAVPGLNSFAGTAGGMRVQYNISGILQPTISDNGIVNAASFQTGGGIAPGSYISIFGSNLSTGSAGVSTSRLPASIRVVSVSFDVPEAGISVPGHLTYANPQQVNVQVPWELAGQHSAKMKVSVQSVSGAVYTVPVADYSPGLFNYTSGGARFGVAQDASFAPITAVSPAVRGQVVTLYGTGFGLVNHTPASGDPAPDASSTTVVTPDVTIGGVPAKVEFCGLAPGFAGLYQLNVTVPTAAPQGNQPVAVSTNGIAANEVLLPIQ